MRKPRVLNRRTPYTRSGAARKKWEESKHRRAQGGRFGEMADRIAPHVGAAPSLDVATPRQPKQPVAANFASSGVSLASGAEVSDQDAARAAWQKFVPMPPAEFKRRLLEGLPSKNSTINVRGHPSNKNLMYLDVTLNDDDGEWIATANRAVHVYNGKLEAAHETFEVDQNQQGKGIAKTFMANSMKLYQDIGVDHIRMVANVNLGGYAWAKYGFMPLPKPDGTLVGPLGREALATRLQQISARYDVSPQQQAAITDAIDKSETDPTALWKLSDMNVHVTPRSGAPGDVIPNGPPASETHLGKLMLSGQTWEARLELGDREAMQRFRDYTEASPAPSLDVASPIPEEALDPAVVDVGGDTWNQDTARRLETEYQSVKPEFDALVSTYESPASAGNTTVPKTWADLPKDTQERIHKQYVDEYTATLPKPGFFGKLMGEKDPTTRNAEDVWKRAYDDVDRWDYAVSSKQVKEGEPIVVDRVLPKTWDALAVDGKSEDYQNTRMVAKYLSHERTMQVIKQRAGENQIDDAELSKRIVKADDRLWKGWVISSTHPDGMVLQAATAEELGGKLNTEHWTDKSDPKGIFEGTKMATHLGNTKLFDRSSDVPIPEQIAKAVDIEYADVGGWEGVKAMVRAKWETSQYLLDKSNAPEFTMYRAIGLDQAALPGPRTKGEAMTNLDLDRNGAASFTMIPQVANGWNGLEAHWQPSDRIVMRARIPRTAALSIPAYGQNHAEEREVVGIGTAWKKWDFWSQTAPEPEHPYAT